MSLSVSALNTYLRSPADFFRQVILKVPQPAQPQLAFGTAVHSALELAYRSWLQTQTVPTDAEILQRFETMLRQAELTPQELDRRLAHGQQVLSAYLTAKPVNASAPQSIERFFGAGSAATLLDDIRLTGKIDRIDWLDQEKKLVTIVDYKTGRSKTVNEINGQTGTTDYSDRELALPAAIRGVYKRQLLFYKLLLQLDHTFTLRAESGTLEYVEAVDGKYVSRTLPLLDEDVEQLKALIREVMAEIRQLKFLDASE